MTRNELLSIVPKDSVVLEIGVFKGDFSNEIIEKITPRELYLVDIWTGDWGSGDKDGNNHINISNMEEEYLNILFKNRYNDSVHIIRTTSSLFLSKIEREYFDMIYIDGDHDGDAVYRDMIGAFNAIKNGGWLMGHDYHHQIKTAVDRFCFDFKQNIQHVTDDGCPTFAIKVDKFPL